MNLLEKINNYIVCNIENKKPSYDFIKNYREKIGCLDYPKLCDIGDINKKFNNHIVFIVDRPNYHFLRQSIEFRKNNKKTLLLTRWGVEPYQSNYFDKIVLYDKIFDLELLSSVENSIFYVQQWVGWSFLVVYIDSIVSCKLYCNINDLTNLLFDDNSELSFMGYSDEDITIDLESETYILENISLVTLNYHENIFNAYELDYSYRYNKSIFTAPCMPSESFFYLGDRLCSKSPSLLYIGGVAPDYKDDEAFSDSKMRDVVEDILTTEIGVTIYNNPQLTVVNSIDSLYSYFRLLSKKNKQFNFQEGYLPWELANYSSSFDYGIMILEVGKFSVSHYQYTYCLPTKLFTYIELKLPIIVNEEYAYVAEFVQSNGIGIVIKRGDVCNIDKIIEKNRSKYSLFIKNIVHYRKKNNMGRQISELCSFFEPC
jgi:hypothetical protein